MAFTWAAVVTDESPETIQLGWGDTQATMTIDINRDNNALVSPQDIAAEILGFPTYYPNRSTYNKLGRKLPWQHPEMSQCWASQITNMRGRKWISKEFSNITLDSFSRYQIIRLTILYTTPPFAIVPDGTPGISDPGGEFYRYTEEQHEYSIDNITRKGNTYKYASVLPSTRLSTDPLNPIPLAAGYPPGIRSLQPIGIGLTIRANKGHIVWTWRQVPRVGLFGTTGNGRPINIQNGIGKLNNAPFPDPFGNNSDNYPTGTLLFLTPKFMPETAPVPSNYLSSGQVNTAYPPRLYKVELHFSYFDPPVDPNWDDGNSLSTAYPFRGHNLVPPPGTNTANPYWYLTTIGGAPRYVGGVPYPGNLINGLYQYYDMRNLWTLS